MLPNQGGGDWPAIPEWEFTQEEGGTATDALSCFQPAYSPTSSLAKQLKKATTHSCSCLHIGGGEQCERVKGGD